ncbi:AGAP007145-PA-like protein [Anopheles sinensis]|uniref:AGAP007145-PA-like protein n=1 Tax=Anopheles sinensis TaxID=74873 RepID=A0A084WEM2_ANOSI|nr:AGAP007145-PA-like protein [Anopheles sinensis]
MAKLLAFYNLCPINNIEDFLGLSRDVDPGCVINTLGRNIILVVKLSNQRQIRSWTVLDRLSSKVVYDFKSERYVAVFGGRYLRCWDRDRPDLNTVKKIKLYRTVQDLFTLASGETLVLYNDGTCESLESALETKKQDKANPDATARKANVNPQTHSIRDVQLLTLEDGTPLITYFVKREEDGQTELNYALLNKSDLKVVKTFEKVKLVRSGSETKLVGCCIVDGSDGPSLLSVWSDSRIFYLQLSLGQSPKRQEGVGNFIEMVQSIDVTQPLSVASIGKDYIAMYAGNTNQDGATLALFNVQVKVFQAKQYFKVYFRASRFWVIESNILLAFGQTLAVVPYKISNQQLADMIGSQCTSFDPSHTIDDESLTEEGEFLDVYSYGGTLPSIAEQSAGEGADDDEDEAEEKPPLYKQFRSEREFEETLRKAYQMSTLPIDIITDETLPDDMVQLKLFNNADPTLGPLVFNRTFEIIAEELECSGCSEQEICNRLVPWLVKANLANDLAKCLKRYSVVSERTIVRALNYAMSLPDGSLEESQNGVSAHDGSSSVKVEDTKKGDALPNPNVFANAQFTHPSHRDLLNIVLSCSFNRTAMVPFVRTELDFPQVTRLLQHLEHLLVDPMATLSETLHTADTFDSDEKTVEWIMVLLDAHYQQFVLSKEPETQEQLKRMLRIVDEHIDGLRQLKSLAPSLERLMVSKGQDKSSGLNQFYSIETIQLY